MTKGREDLGKAAYEAYRSSVNWPGFTSWEEQKEATPGFVEAWIAAAEAVREIVAEELY